MTGPEPPHGPDADSRSDDAQYWDRLWDLHSAALELEPAAREAFLTEACAGHQELRQELRAMLAAEGESAALEIEGKLLESETGALDPGTRVGTYRLLRRLARGGMGEVYLAERDDNYSQLVAIKMLRPGLESTAMLDRFFAERDVLARLTHPAVVPLLDAGLGDENRPYLVLPYVQGAPITDHCERQSLSRSQRLRLFTELCRVVQYAHSNLIVHRDLKPSNVLVDEHGEVRLLDFGIAKLLARSQAGQLTGVADLAPMTPDRAAPEQLQGGPATTATDVWGLGLLLLEMLTGQLPDREPDGGVRLQPASAPDLPRDLVAVMRRALARAPERRYTSAGELADEVDRWQAGKPVRAQPDSLPYRARRFVGRNRATVAFGSLAVLALLAMTVVSSLHSARATREGLRAASEERKAKAVVDLLVQTFAATDPHQGAVGDQVSIDQLLSQGEARAAEMDDQPQVQAALRRALGRVRLERGAFQQARDLLGPAWQAERDRLGIDDLNTVSLRVDLARALHATGEGADAEQLLREALQAVERARDPEPEHEIVLLQALGTVVAGEEAITALERAVSLYRQIEDRDPVPFADVLTTLAVRRLIAGDRDGAEAAFAEAQPLFVTALGADSPRALAVRSNLAQLDPDLEQREVEYRAILALRRERLGDRSYAVASSWHRLGLTLAELERHSEAVAALESSLQIWAELHGAGSTMHRRVLRASARSLDAQGLVQKANQAYDELEGHLQAAGKEQELAALREERRARAVP